jgi:diguanylate cyclase (GGDEF)-like protein
MASGSSSSRRWRPILAGAVASLFAPAGWLGYRLVAAGADPLAELAAWWPLYVYLFAGAAGLAATSVIWWVNADRRLTEARLRIERVSRSDAATGLMNAAGLQELVAQYAAMATRKSFGLALARITVSASIGGLSAADRLAVYRAVAAGLRAGRRKEDTIARLTRGEFAVLLPCADAEGARVAVERMLASVREKKVPLTAGGALKLELAAGFSTLLRKENAALLARRAERSLAAAKRAGGKTVVCLDGEESPAPVATRMRPAAPAQAPSGDAVLGLEGAADTSLAAFADDTDADTDAAVESALGSVLERETGDEPLFPIDIEEEPV